MQAGQENGGDLYAKRMPENATGGVALGPASAASAAVERAAALGGPRMLRCDLCQVMNDSVDTVSLTGTPRLCNALQGFLFGPHNEACMHANTLRG